MYRYKIVPLFFYAKQSFIASVVYSWMRLNYLNVLPILFGGVYLISFELEFSRQQCIQFYIRQGNFENYLRKHSCHSWGPQVFSSCLHLVVHLGTDSSPSWRKYPSWHSTSQVLKMYKLTFKLYGTKKEQNFWIWLWE